MVYHLASQTRELIYIIHHKQIILVIKQVVLLLATTMNVLLLLLLLDVAFFCIKTCKGIRSNDDLTSTNNGIEFSQGMLHCCISGKCPCHSFNDLLINITSDVTICVTTDMVLSSLVRLTHLKNVSIIGHNNPTILSGYNAGLYFASCQNITITGITWIGHGINAKFFSSPAVAFLLYIINLSNINFQNCTFQNSLGQSIVLSEVSGSVNINNCKFTHNKYYNNHGAAIYYSSNDNSKLTFMINNCTFDYNEGNSIVYLNHSATLQKYLLLENSVFNNNQGSSIYILNQQLHINGVVLFEENNATNGGGLYLSDHATVIFNESSVVRFSNNFANSYGGGIFLSKKAMISFEQNSIVVFNGNAAGYGELCVRIMILL